MAKAIMVQGTTSNAGKSLITAGLCRLFRQDGYRVAPFKSQNMALNSFITQDGLEMGRAQVMQAEAAGIEPDVRMNPILLKPTTDVGSQVILNGEVLGNMGAVDYFAYKQKLIPDLLRAYESLAAEYDIIVLEGAGSPAEINLKQHDIVNMGMAKMARAPVLLVGDIDRGGVFASLYGTVSLLEPDERAMIKGLVINKFRGDLEILRPGIAMLEELVHIPVIGTIPYLRLDLEDEDSLAPRLSQGGKKALLDFAVIRLPCLSNFTDFNPLERFESVSVRYVRTVQELGHPDLILLPGTKNTMSDLLWMRSNGLEAAILREQNAGTPLIGICGGYQMLCEALHDPQGLEHGGTLRGMGLLSNHTVFAPQKTRTRVSGTVCEQVGFFAPLSGATFTGYEIHMGRTTGEEVVFSNLSESSGNSADGSVKGNVLGSYVHGIFEEGSFALRLVNRLLEQKGLAGEQPLMQKWADYKSSQYDALAKGLRENMDIAHIYRMVEAGISPMRGTR